MGHFIIRRRLSKLLSVRVIAYIYFYFARFIDHFKGATGNMKYSSFVLCTLAPEKDVNTKGTKHKCSKDHLTTRGSLQLIKLIEPLGGDCWVSVTLWTTTNIP